MFKSMFRNKLLVLSADKLWNIVRDKALRYSECRKVRFGHLHYCCSERVGQNIAEDRFQSNHCNGTS